MPQASGTALAAHKMTYSYREDVTRPRVRDITRVGAAVIFLALLSGVYLSGWLSLPFGLTMAASLALFASLVVRRHRNALRRLRELQLDIDSSQLRLEDGGGWRTIACREDVGAITHDEDDVIAVYDRCRAPVFRVALRSLENGDAFWTQLRQWGPVTQVPRGHFSAPESCGALLAIGVFVGFSILTGEPIPVIGLATVSTAFLLWYMRVPWRHRHVSSTAQRIVWAAMSLGTILTIRIAVVVLGG